MFQGSEPGRVRFAVPSIPDELVFITDAAGNAVAIDTIWGRLSRHPVIVGSFAERSTACKEAASANKQPEVPTNGVIGNHAPSVSTVLLHFFYGR